MPKGNPNPSPATRFKKGRSGNPCGMSSKHRELIAANALLATELRNKMLESIAAILKGQPKRAAFGVIGADTLRLLKDAEDRGYGAPKESVDVTTNGKDMPGAIDLSALSSEALAELIAARDAVAKPD